ncbi:FAD-binding oxidoreductase [Leeia sp. TBRC 13508]|uniref:D-lactate dehydrogenase (cytochrome) n=1 Tax=Leeia speluncae TaxID=2884804 RepID=A0ABS8D9P9_9NEIS|nr:FAD-binding and (Fe-S)-binding domain-containing protein [Leeia speluncae]MCB6184872.1 FAD-binding oxidoreductase [Leeia speluncae]
MDTKPRANETGTEDPTPITQRARETLIMTHQLPAAYQAFYEEICTKVPTNRLFTDPMSTLAYGTDASFYRLIPKIVIRVDNEAEVSAIMAAANQHKLPVTYRAAGTSLSGQAVSDSILVVMGDGFDQGEVLNHGAQLKVKPGMIGAQANKLLAPFGKKIGPDPASIGAAKIGGIVANNSSGMCCGTHHNTYHTLQHLRVMLADGTILDTSDTSSVANFRVSHKNLLNGLMQLSGRIQADEALKEKVRHKYRLKNTTGYGINALLDYTDPIDMLSHLMVGSEGTLGFISEVTFNTVADHPHKASCLVLFDELDNCCRAVTALRESAPVEAVELIDSRSIRAVQNKKGLPDFMYQTISDQVACLLIETHGADAETLNKQIAHIGKVLEDFHPSAYSGFSTDPAVCETYWIVRKGLFPAVGATRALGTTVIIEDVAFPVDHLAEGVRGLTALFDEHGYPDALLFGHALEGNLHFVFAPDLESPSEVARYDGFMKAIAELVADRFGGSLKAEHGTGRNVAPFVKQEWGDAAYAIMCEIKHLFDPENLLNPDVIISGNASVHLENIKRLPAADPIVDKCIECGFCEAACPSNGLSLTPRQRIVMWRRMEDLRRSGKAADELAYYRQHYPYAGVDSCAATGMCATRCPVGINTGELMKKLKGDSKKTGRARFAARNMQWMTRGTRIAIRLSHVLGADSMNEATKALHKTFKGIPILPASMPKAARQIQAPALRGKSPVVYFVSCVNRTVAEGTTGQQSLAEHTISLLQKAGFDPVFPPQMDKLCCGQPFISANAKEAADESTTSLNGALLAASKNGELPVYLDNSPCAYRIMQAQQEGKLDSRLKLFDAATFLRQQVLPNVKVSKQIGELAVHVPCSASRMGTGSHLVALASACAQKINVPDIACCGFAGNKGFELPELNANGLRKLKKQLPDSCQHGVSMSRTCQIGLTEHSGIEYASIEALLDACTTTGN